MSEQNPKPLKKGRLDEVLQTEEINSPRPELLNRAESELPAHERASNTDVPVTPGIHLTTYHDEDEDKEDRSTSPSYFTTNPANPTTQGSNVTNHQSGTSKGASDPSTTHTAEGVMSDQDVLRRMSLASKGRRQSITDIKETVPELALTGNIISAAFNLPYALKYRQSGDWELGSRRGQSALYDAFSYLSSDESPWNHTVVAWTGEIETPYNPLSPPGTPPGAVQDGTFIPKEHQLDLEQQLAHDKRIKTVPVWLADDDEMSDEGITLTDQNRWRRYADHELYTLFHYKQHEPTDGRAERIQWADYYRMNLKFANKIIEIYKPGDLVVIHDFYLMLLPSMLRQRAPNMYISFYLHCPFPSSEFLRCLPRRKEVLEGVLGANLVGFQSYSYSRHFSSCCTRVLDFPSDSIGVDAYGTRVEVGVFPIGIDFAKVEQLAWSPSVSKAYESLKHMYAGKKIIVGRDRLDSVRGVAQKLMAFERFLELYPEWAEKVVLIQVTSPTSIEEDSENKIASRVNELVMRINGAFGGLTFSPVQHYPQYLSHDEYFALLRAADIGLITSVRDGMNTTSLEYVVCQRDNHGPLILSEFSGTAGFLRDAIHINPWDLSGVASQLNNALTMDAKEREAMQKPLYNHVAQQNVQSWITKFLRKLVSNLASNSNASATPLLDRTKLLARYRSAKKRLFMFDYDGTLTPIVREPSAAVPSERVIQTLKTLAADHQNDVWIISGRDQEFLQQHLGHISELGFSAEHGSFMRHPGETTWENLAEKFDMSWQDEVVAIFQKYTDRVHGSFIERKRCALTWHYRQADPEQGLHAARECQKELEDSVAKKWDVDVMTGKANLEVRPTFINKGEIAKRLVNDYNKDISHVNGNPSSEDPSELGFVLCMGDDFTDEDMFRALSGLTGVSLEPQNVFTVTVGASTKVTLARWHILEPADVVEATSLLAGAGSSGRNDDNTVLSSVNLAAVAGLDGKVPEL
ncbi:calcineurin-like phosphoesterase [Apiospora arundinis]